MMIITNDIFNNQPNNNRDNCADLGFYFVFDSNFLIF